MTPSTAPLAVADRALLAACRGWSEDADDRFWNRFEPGWRRRLQLGWNDVLPLRPDEARERVRLERQAQAHPDWNRIHPSWWLRALKDETRSVQRAVVAHAPRALRAPLQAGLGLSDEDLQAQATPQPEALKVALTLWSERLVGDWPDRDDPPVILALTRLDLNEITQLIAATGLTKWTLAGAELPADTPQSHARTQTLQAVLAALDPQLKTQAQADVSRYGQVERDKLGSIGLVTFARLLEVVEPYRVRWSLQHLPYKVAKLLRTLMTRADRGDSTVVRWESEILESAWDHLRDEGRVRDASGAMP